MVSSFYYVMGYLSLSHGTWLSDDLQRSHKALVLKLKKRFADSLSSILKVLFLILPPMITHVSSTVLLPSLPFLFPGNNTYKSVITLSLVNSPNSSVCRSDKFAVTPASVPAPLEKRCAFNGVLVFL